MANKSIDTFYSVLIICDDTGIIFDGETKLSMGKQQKQGGESALNSKLAEKHFPGGSSSCLGGAAFQRGRYCACPRK